MKRIILYAFSVLFILLSVSGTALAVVNPLNAPNNKIGIHILFPHELEKAAEMINTSGGDYGYVTIAIQAGDKDLEKWQNFLDEAKRLHLIPIIRLATEADLQNTAVWRKPTDYDIVDFANFLNSLNWPYKNRYILAFNEVNRADEWGGALNPSEYAEILSYTVTVFKSKSPDFFIISAGLDNAAPNQYPLYMNQYDYMRAMNAGIPGIFNQIDGVSSHSYPNPGFSQLPTLSSPMGANSFHYERSLIRTLSGKNHPIFITETGWSTEAIPHITAANYYHIALNTVWNDENIVAVTPFLLQGSGGPFQKFSFLDGSGGKTSQFESIKNYPKVRGRPELSKEVLATSTKNDDNQPDVVNNFDDHTIETKKIAVSTEIKYAIKWLLKL